MVLQIQHDLGLIPESAAEAEAHAMALLGLYKHSLSLCKGLDPKEKAPGDDLIPLAVASFMAARNLDTVHSRDAASADAHHRLVQKHMMQVTLKTQTVTATQTHIFVFRIVGTAGQSLRCPEGKLGKGGRLGGGRGSKTLLRVDLRLSSAVGLLYNKGVSSCVSQATSTHAIACGHESIYSLC